MQTDHRFPDLVRKPVWREKLEAMPKADIFLMKKDGSLEQVAFGEGYGQSDASGTDVRLGAGFDDADESSTLPQFVKCGLKMIAELPEFAGEKPELKLVCLPGKTQPVFSLPIVIDEDGEINIKLDIVSESGVGRRRRVCVVELCTEQLKVYFSILEKSGSAIDLRLMKRAVLEEVVAAEIAACLGGETDRIRCFAKI